MCIYIKVEYTYCGHEHTVVSQWCDQYRRTLQSNYRCRPDVQHYQANRSYCKTCLANLQPRTQTPWEPMIRRHRHQTTRSF